MTTRFNPLVRQLVAAALLLAALSAPSAVAAKSKAPSREPILAAKTTLRGDHTARIRVRIPRQATLQYRSAMSWSPAVTVSGPGRFVGLAIIRVTGNAATRQWFAQTRVTGCGTRNCMPGRSTPPDIVDGQLIAAATGFPETTGKTEWDHLVFPAGEYDLTLIADAATVSVTLSLDGLTGKTTLSPPTAVGAVSQSVSPSLLPTPLAANELSAGAQSTLTSNFGVVVFAISYRFTVRVGDLSNWCLFSGTHPPPNGQYLPGCVGDDRVVSPPSFIILQQGVNVPSGSYGIAFVIGKQTWSQGFWAAGASLIQSSKPATFLWLPIN